MKKTNKMRHAGFLLTLFLLSLWIAGCYKDYGMSIEDYDLVTAFYDKEVDFSAITSYALPDTVFHIVPEEDEDDVDRSLDSQIVQQINLNMQTLGYEKLTLQDIEDGRLPDVVLLAAVTSTKNSVWYPGYPGYPGWGFWPGWGYYPGYPGGGWYYPPYWTGTTFTTGSLLITMIDPEETDIEEEKVKVVWAGGVNGLLDDKKENVKRRLVYSIAEMFRISPYLGASNTED
ncbi:DUF4136 domain-containing protein [candidate division KSB1 bacterium]|nr:DUF4136 domain-containing protein [candidate division KSB1 bacterium]RQW03013.1 MAG: DUF4136 domain-containing protein [candidate division KSB1 bacterium]